MMHRVLPLLSKRQFATGGRSPSLTHDPATHWSTIALVSSLGKEKIELSVLKHKSFPNGLSAPVSPMQRKKDGEKKCCSLTLDLTSSSAHKKH